jgi:hypothetical protein
MENIEIIGRHKDKIKIIREDNFKRRRLKNLKQ